MNDSSLSHFSLPVSLWAAENCKEWTECFRVLIINIWHWDLDGSALEYFVYPCNNSHIFPENQGEIYVWAKTQSESESAEILAFNEMHIFFIKFETFPNLGEYWDDSCFDMLFISLFSFHSFSVLHLRFQSALEPCVPSCCEEEPGDLLCEFEFAGLRWKQSEYSRKCLLHLQYQHNYYNFGK